MEREESLNIKRVVLDFWCVSTRQYGSQNIQYINIIPNVIILNTPYLKQKPIFYLFNSVYCFCRSVLSRNRSRMTSSAIVAETNTGKVRFIARSRRMLQSSRLYFHFFLLKGNHVIFTHIYFLERPYLASFVSEI